MSADAKPAMTLYSYWRSSAAYRVRIALNLKDLAYETIEVSLIDGEQRGPGYLAINPQGLVPFLRDGDVGIGQSLAILEYLEERYPATPLLPKEPAARAAARQLAAMIACDIHPLCNLRVLRYLEHTIAVDEDARLAWYRHWVTTGFEAIEAKLVQLGSRDVCVGDSPGMADACLIPQVYNACRYDVSLEPFPRICRIEAHCNAVAGFQAALPENQSRNTLSNLS